MNDDIFALPAQLFPFANALTSAVMLHRGGKILLANDALSRLSGYAPEELARMDFWALFPPPACDRLRERDSGRLDIGSRRVGAVRAARLGAPLQVGWGRVQVRVCRLVQHDPCGVQQVVDLGSARRVGHRRFSHSPICAAMPKPRGWAIPCPSNMSRSGLI